MPVRRTLTAASLLLAAMMVPALAWAGAHVLEHHHGDHHEAAELAEILVHGHQHQEGIPDHEHDLLPSPPVRPDAPRDLQAPALGLENPDAGRLLLSDARPWRSRIRPAGSGPPRLDLLCVLLI